MKTTGGSRPSDKGRPGHPDPEIKEGGGGPVSEILFSALRTSFWSKNKGEGGGGAPGPSPEPATGNGPIINLDAGRFSFKERYFLYENVYYSESSI